MKPNKIFPAANIAFYVDDYIYNTKFISELYQHANDPVAGIEIFIHGPWQQPVMNSSISARYVIGQSYQGYHWRTEFSFESPHYSPADTLELQPEALGYSAAKWSPASLSMHDAVKRARRCIAIQAKNFDLDTKSKITLRFENGKQEFFDIDKIPLELDLMYRISKDDLHRLALFNGYLSWYEFEQGALDLASFHPEMAFPAISGYEK